EWRRAVAFKIFSSGESGFAARQCGEACLIVQFSICICGCAADRGAASDPLVTESVRRSFTALQSGPAAVPASALSEPELLPTPYRPRSTTRAHRRLNAIAFQAAIHID